MKNQILIHKHRHGIDVYPFKSETDYSGWYHSDEDLETINLLSLCAILGVEFEPDRDETIDIVLVGEFVEVE